MSDTIIKVEDLGKKYVLSRKQEGGQYKTLRDAMTDTAKSLSQKLFKPSGKKTFSPAYEEFWALRDISFEIKQGDRVGIIGRNGAGKSTLLKILSRITEPTKGTVRIKGRVASLLEVGTGFHPELTGRENIFLNGAILGMSRAEITRKFDEIVAFAEVEKFLDTPVKRYSSGMYVRLAFAVAAHLEPEILIVDEVLAVGDAQFQEKCLGKMQEVGKGGRTVLFVSHNMASIQYLCSTAILLKSGNIAAIGQPAEIIGDYFADTQKTSSISLKEWIDRSTSGEGKFTQLEITNSDGKPTSSVLVGGKICFKLYVEFYEPIVDPCFGVIIHNVLGEPMLDIRSTHDGLRVGRVKDSIVIQVCIENLGLYPGRYFLSPWIADSSLTHDIDFVQRCCYMQVEPAPGPYGDLQLDPLWGKYWIQSNWMIN